MILGGQLASIEMANCGPGQLASDRNGFIGADDNQHERQEQRPTTATAAASEMRRQRAGQCGQRALGGASWCYLVSARIQRGQCSRIVRNQNPEPRASSSVGDNVKIATLIAIISIGLALASVSSAVGETLVEHVDDESQRSHHSRSQESARTSRADAKLPAQLVHGDDDATTKFNRLANEPGPNLQSGAHDGAIRAQDDNEPSESRAAGQSAERPQSNRNATLRTGGAGQVCADCLAIPLVALVGGRQINGFIVRQASLHAPLPRAKFNPATPADGHDREPSSGGVPSRVINNHNNRPHQEQLMGERSPSPAADYSRPKPYHTNPFEPKSDAQCPMAGHVTVCDQIGSYPADVILHKLHNLERALYRSHFNIDSFFSDESDNLSDPFETPPRRPAETDLRAFAGEFVMPKDEIYSNRTAAHPNEQSAYGTDGVKSSSAAAGNRLRATAKGANLARDGKGKSFARPRFGTGPLRSAGDRAQSQVPLDDRPPSRRGPRVGESLAEGESIIWPFSRSGKMAADEQMEPRPGPSQSSSATLKLLYLEERRESEFAGAPNSIHNPEPAKVSRERPALAVSGTHKIGATTGLRAPDESEKKVASSGANKDEDHDDGPRDRREPGRATTTFHASESSVESGRRLRSAPSKSLQTHKLSQQQRLNLEPTRTAGLQIRASERLGPNISAARVQHDVEHGSVHDGHGDGALEGRASKPKLISQQAPAKPASGPARNNHGQRRPSEGVGPKLYRQLDGGGPSKSNVDSFVLPALSAMSFAGARDAGERADTPRKAPKRAPGISSAPGRDRQLNFLPPVALSLALSINASAGQIELKSPPARSVASGSRRLSQVGVKFVTKKTTDAKEVAKPLTKIQATLLADANSRARAALNGLERLKRQATESTTELNNGATGGPQSAGLDSDEPTTNVDSEAQSAVAQPICRARSIYISPRAAVSED